MENRIKIFTNILIELQKMGEKIPKDIIQDLRSAKTLIKVLKADPTNNENMPRIDTYLRNVESYSILTADKGEKGRAEKWLKKLKTRKKTEKKKKKELDSRFIPGIPKNESWIRIEISEEMNEHEKYIIIF